MTYSELKWQIDMRVLEKESYNDNILGKLFRTDTDKELYAAHLEKMKLIPRKPKAKKEITY